MHEKTVYNRDNRRTFQGSIAEHGTEENIWVSNRWYSTIEKRTITNAICSISDWDTLGHRIVDSLFCEHFDSCLISSNPIDGRKYMIDPWLIVPTFRWLCSNCVTSISATSQSPNRTCTETIRDVAADSAAPDQHWVSRPQGAIGRLVHFRRQSCTRWK